MSWRRQVAVISIIALLIVPTFVPAMLLFPYRATSGTLTVRSEQPIDQSALDRIAARSAALVTASPLARPSEPRNVFLTNGGWRWTWLAIRYRNAFAVSRPFTEPLIFNRSDLGRDKLYNGTPAGATRTLSGVIAHETCHGLIRRRFGVTADHTKPTWLREGYCDYVAKESTLSDADAKRIAVSDPEHPALVYHAGRKRVAAELARNGGDVDALFAAH